MSCMLVEGSIPSDERVHVGDGDQDLHCPIGQRLATVSWSRSRESSLSIEHQRRVSEIALPGLPDHTEKRLLFDLLGGEARLAIQLTESLAMLPAASVCGFYFSHPEARYFSLGKIGRDQVLDYHRRKGMDLAAVERWLAPNLGYDPASA